jgi:hypothetical protein
MLKLSTRLFAAGVFAATLAGINLDAQASEKVNVKVTKVTAKATVNGKAAPVTTRVSVKPVTVKTTVGKTTVSKTVTKKVTATQAAACCKDKSGSCCKDDMADCCKDEEM